MVLTITTSLVLSSTMPASSIDTLVPALECEARLTNQPSHPETIMHISSHFVLAKCQHQRTHPLPPSTDQDWVWIIKSMTSLNLYRAAMTHGFYNV